LIATVDSVGHVFAIRDGTTRVRFTAYVPQNLPCWGEKLTAGSRVVVECANALRDITLTPSESTAAVGDSVDYDVVVPSPCFAGTITEADTSVAWSSSDTSVAVVLDSLGRVRAVGEGAAIVTATLQTDPSHSASARLEVTD
jgi:uncharacterized protein YjdB